ncbi:MAG: anthranilate synthase component I [Candidatus Saganbacteria bacterium]|nr:anthranilate synthase component I [Candidatus Saganbacteria bacterium]
MYFPNKNEFLELSKKGNLIPVYREIIADTETPVSALSKIAGKYSFLLESVEGGENLARYSFLGCDPEILFRSKGGDIEIISVSGKRKTTEKKKGDPLKALKEVLGKYKPVDIEGLPRFHGGAVGYIGYDTVRFFENIPDKNRDELKVPDCQFLLTDTFLAFDHVKHKIIVISNAFIENDPQGAYDKAVAKIEAIAKKLKKASSLRPLDISGKKKQLKIESNTSKNEFEKSVEAAKEYIKAGDVIQVVLSQRLSTGAAITPLDVYRSLRTINPSPYMYYFSFDGMHLIGSSPEVMVRLENGTATVRPIAGTMPRGKDENEDKALEKELLSDEKEKAEHIMLVDLARNDLGRVCETGTIKISDFMSIERYSHVMHIVTNVSGKLSSGKDAFDLFAASFPAGTVSGAPKVRAMEIIDELENVKRGPYAGAVGYFDFRGNLDTCITIRTILMIGKKAYIQAGAGIVADSVPEKEYFESLNKARALLKAIEDVSK